ncbi:MAG: twin-arginine translocase TatA/TatE family subunit [Pseudomonadota bacterium]
MLSNISIWQLLIILAIVIAIFGTSKLRNMGSDLGGAVKGFRKAVKEAEEEPPRNLPEGNDADFEAARSEESTKNN